jgi:broad specificity phosphatase PhoE
MSASASGMPADRTADASALTVVHLMRHGEVHNPEGLLYGRLEGYRLSDLGQRMAVVVAQHLDPNDITYVVASSLERAQQTATPVAEAHELPIATDDRVIEAANHFEGRSVGMSDLLHPRNWHLFGNPRTPSWGEPYEEIAERMLSAIDDARRAAHGHEAVIVSHQLPIWTARNKLSGRRLWHDPRRRECSLASLTSFTYENGQIVAVEYSEPAKDLLPTTTTRIKPGA